MVVLASWRLLLLMLPVYIADNKSGDTLSDRKSAAFIVKGVVKTINVLL